MKRIRFQGKEWIMVEGAITTPEAFASFSPSYAHYFEERNVIRRFHETIGTGEDIEYLGDVDEEENKKLSLEGMGSFLENPTKFLDEALEERKKSPLPAKGDAE